MLQFLTEKSEKYSVAEETQMAIEGGCRWIQVTRKTDEGMTLKETVQELIPVCEENDAFLMIDSDVELCNEMRVHGVHLHKGDMSPSEAREILGPHAVIGVDVGSFEDILSLKGLDIDYVVLHPFGQELFIDDYRRIIAQVKEQGIALPVVARGDICVEDVIPLRQAGISGLALSQPIINADDPVKTTEKIIDQLTNPLYGDVK